MFHVKHPSGFKRALYNPLISWYNQREIDPGPFLERIESYIELLVFEKRVRNIIGSSGQEAIIKEHVIPSLELSRIIKGANGIDLGSGNGLPGIIIAINRPDIDLTLIEAKASRVNFLKKAQKELKIQNLQIVHSRAEEEGRKSKWREKFDCGTCRAVAELRITAELMLPFLRRGGIFYAQRGDNSERDIITAEDILGNLGGTVSEVRKDGVLIIEKKRATPAEFPRKWKKIVSGS
ncbi:MAG: 16S rRNA (guanine(527)-N(7))-methyltransferase RsmG [Elusimicrobiota bacterium]